MSLSNMTERSPVGESAISQASQQVIPQLTSKKQSRWREWMHTIVVLFKLRIVFLLLMAATSG
ncbi:MAG: hypothetical protein D6835_04815, partial [Candidatus Thermofonsia bacterium]